MIHSVGCCTENFESLVRGNLTFVIIENSTFFQIGDYLALNERNEDDTGYTRRSAMFVIDYVMKYEDMPLALGYDYVVLGIRPCIIVHTDKPSVDVVTGKERKI